MNSLDSNAWEKYITLMHDRPKLFRQSENLEIITDYTLVEKFEQATGRTIGVVYQSRFNTMVVDLVRKPVKAGCVDSGTASMVQSMSDPLVGCFAYERVIPTETGGIVSVPIYQGQFVLLRQYRHAIRQIQYAFPRGFGEPGISAEQNLHKELKEEIGALQISNVKHLGQIAPDSGLSAGLIDVFACEVDQVKEKNGYEGIASIELLSPVELDQWIAQGRINDGFTLGAFLLLKENHNYKLVKTQ